MSIFFTTGATVTFEPLVEHVTRPDFLSALHHLGFSNIVIQYGNHIDKGKNLSKQFFSKCLSDNQTVEKLNLDLTNETNDKSVTTFSNGSLSILAFAFSAEVSRFISKADIVVSHAGTGSIMDSLRLGKPLVVVTNEKLMDNHQEEVAAQFEQEGHLYKVLTADLEKRKLEELLEKFQKKELEFRVLPDPPTGIVESIIAEEAGA